MRIVVRGLFLLLAACGGDPVEDARPADADGDGYASTWRGGDDCDDRDPAVHPGAVEVCDGVDNDCDVNIDEADAADATTWYADADGDGYGAAQYPRVSCEQPDHHVANALDCDDRSDFISPDGVEHCNQVDDDCDGEIDEDALDARTWYADADADDYGDPAVTALACVQPDGFLDNDDDCDDTNFLVNPEARETWYDGVDQNCDDWSDYDADYDTYRAVEYGGLDCDDTTDLIQPFAAERCNFVDEDCDGEVDEDPVDGFPYFPDRDGDGFGDAEAVTYFCADPADGVMVNDAADCDDTDPDVNPMATEVCGDGLDNDCDEGARGCGLAGAIPVADAIATLSGDAVSDAAGCAVAAAGDLDGDGDTELMVGASGYDGTGGGAGAVFVHLGPVTGDWRVTDAGLVLTGVAAGDQAGAALAAPGDMDGDGFADLLVAAPSSDDAAVNAGTVYLVRGPATGTLSLGDASLVIDGDRAADFLGLALDGGLDVDGDGWPDLALAAPMADDGESTSGSIYLISGPVSGAGNASSFASPFTGVVAQDEAGTSLALVGDLDGDGLADLAVGAPNQDAAGTNSGRVYVVHGPADGLATLHDADAAYDGDGAGDGAGSRVAGRCDFDGDGLADLLVGAPYLDVATTSEGAAYVVLGPASAGGSLSDARLVVLGLREEDYLGSAVACAGDISGNGADAILLGAPKADFRSSDQGVAWIFQGPVSGTLTADAALAFVFGRATNDELGGAVAPAGDVNGDGYDDILVGASQAGPSSSLRVGRAYLLGGGPGF